MDDTKFGELAKELRTRNGLSQVQVAEALNVTPGFICNIEKGRTAMSLRLLTYYAKMMHVSVDSLIGQIEPEYRATSLDREILEALKDLPDEVKMKVLNTIQLWKR